MEETKAKKEIREKIESNIKQEEINQKGRKKQRGITLIALIVTIIVLLILAGVTITTLTGDNGILTRAQEAKNKTEQAGEEELRKLTQVEAGTYLEDYEYIDNSTGEDRKIIIPAQCAVSQVEGENTLKEGLVIIDINGNEWVWIEVPKGVFTSASNQSDYLNIENDLKEYTKDYSNNKYNDIFYDESVTGLTEVEYNNLKNSMLSSIYEYNGFYVSRYEIGSNSYVNENDITRIPMSKKDLYPYNYVTCAQAQEISARMNLESRTSNILFGIQWDLILKFIEKKGALSKNNLISDSTSWGNYFDSNYTLTHGMYNIFNQEASNLTDWITVKEPIKRDENWFLLSTGALEQNKILNIYDLAGNTWEYTLERSQNTSIPVTARGGCYNGSGKSITANSRLDVLTDKIVGSISFRTSLY